MGKKSRRNKKKLTKSGSSKQLPTFHSAVKNVVGHSISPPAGIFASQFPLSLLSIAKLNDAMVVIDDDDGWENFVTWTGADCEGAIDRFRIEKYLPKSCVALREGKIDPFMFSCLLQMVYDRLVMVDFKENRTTKFVIFLTLESIASVAIQKDIASMLNRSISFCFTSQNLKEHMPISYKALIDGQIDPMAFVDAISLTRMIKGLEPGTLRMELFISTVDDLMHNVYNAGRHTIAGARAYDMLENLSVEKVEASGAAIEEDGWESFIKWAKLGEDRINNIQLAKNLPNLYKSIREGMIDLIALGRLMFYCCYHIDINSPLVSTESGISSHVSMFVAQVAVNEDGGAASLKRASEGCINKKKLIVHLPKSCKALGVRTIGPEAFLSAIRPFFEGRQIQVRSNEDVYIDYLGELYTAIMDIKETVVATSTCREG